MNLLVDAGNTTVKFGLVEDDVITQILSLSTISFSKTEVERLLKQYYPFQTIGLLLYLYQQMRFWTLFLTKNK